MKEGNKLKKVLKTMLVALGIFALCGTNVSAREIVEPKNFNQDVEINHKDIIELPNVPNYNVVDYNPFKFGISTFSQDKPSNVWNLSDGSTYHFSGTGIYHNLYTNYSFTGATILKVIVTVEEGSSNWEGFSGTITLYKDGIIDSKVGSFNVEDGKTRTMYFRGLNAKSKYYLKFSAPMVFSGSITAFD